MGEASVKSLDAASDAAGKYLDSIGKSDLAALTQDEWMTLLVVVVDAWSRAMHGPADEAPF